MPFGDRPISSSAFQPLCRTADGTTVSFLFVPSRFQDARGPKGGVLERAKQMLDEDMDDATRENTVVSVDRSETGDCGRVSHERSYGIQCPHGEPSK